MLPFVTTLFPVGRFGKIIEFPDALVWSFGAYEQWKDAAAGVWSREKIILSNHYNAGVILSYGTNRIEGFYVFHTIESFIDFL